MKKILSNPFFYLAISFFSFMVHNFLFGASTGIFIFLFFVSSMAFLFLFTSQVFQAFRRKILPKDIEDRR